MSLFPTYNRFNVTVKSADGTVVEDINGKQYLDFGSGIGVCNLGHRHPAVLNSVRAQLDEYWHVSNLYHMPIQEEVAKKIRDNTPADAVFFCNSGAEANEAAIKLARKATGKDKIITFHQSFHGRTFATMAATGQEKVRQGFGTMLPTFAYATFNDIDSVKELADENTAAVMLEMIQGEGGVHPADEEFIKELKEFCEAKGILIIVDEIQTGCGRTGKRFAFEHYGLEPDIFTMAKALGNGLPIGAMGATAAYRDYLNAGSHGSTFGGNPLAMAAASAVTEIIFDEKFLETVNDKAAYLHQLLLKLDLKAEIRQLGFMIGIECEENVMPYVTALMDKGLLVLPAGEKVLRLLPPLTVSKAEIEQAAEILTEVLNESIKELS